MKNVIGSISTIKNFMGNASRTTCNEYLYEALQDAVECMERHIPRKPRKVNPCKTVTYYLCPVCDGIVGIRKNFCEHCGQLIDWD